MEGVVNVRFIIPAQKEKFLKFMDGKGFKIEPDDVFVTGEDEVTDEVLAGFQRGRRMMAEDASVSKFYIVADDDMVMGEHGVVEALRTMLKYPEFGVVVPLPTNANIVDWTGESGAWEIDKDGDRYEVYNDPFIMEHVDVGGIRFTRFGSVKDEWPEQEDNRRDKEVKEGWTYDRAHAIAVRRSGMRVGYLKRVRSKHLGERGKAN